jgi:oligopeptide/dipeptide ABC transporter ATP-binding protein
MYLGRIVEIAPAGPIFTAPRHPYTRALLAAAPRLERDRAIGGGMIEGEPPSPRNLPSGCAFRTRCPYAKAPCAEVVPELSPAGAAHEVACLRWREIEAEAPARAASEVPA